MKKSLKEKAYDNGYAKGFRVGFNHFSNLICEGFDEINQGTTKEQERESAKSSTGDNKSYKGRFIMYNDSSDNTERQPIGAFTSGEIHSVSADNSAVRQISRNGEKQILAKTVYYKFSSKEKVDINNYEKTLPSVLFGISVKGLADDPQSAYVGNEDFYDYQEDLFNELKHYYVGDIGEAGLSDIAKEIVYFSGKAKVNLPSRTKDISAVNNFYGKLGGDEEGFDLDNALGNFFNNEREALIKSNRWKVLLHALYVTFPKLRPSGYVYKYDPSIFKLFHGNFYGASSDYYELADSKNSSDTSKSNRVVGAKGSLGTRFISTSQSWLDVEIVMFISMLCKDLMRSASGDSKTFQNIDLAFKALLKEQSNIRNWKSIEWSNFNNAKGNDNHIDLVDNNKTGSISFLLNYDKAGKVESQAGLMLLFKIFGLLRLIYVFENEDKVRSTCSNFSNLIKLVSKLYTYKPDEFPYITKGEVVYDSSEEDEESVSNFDRNNAFVDPYNDYNKDNRFNHDYCRIISRIFINDIIKMLSNNKTNEVESYARDQFEYFDENSRAVDLLTLFKTDPQYRSQLELEVGKVVFDDISSFILEASYASLVNYMKQHGVIIDVSKDNRNNLSGYDEKTNKYYIYGNEEFIMKDIQGYFGLSKRLKQSNKTLFDYRRSARFNSERSSGDKIEGKTTNELETSYALTRIEELDDLKNDDFSFNNFRELFKLHHDDIEPTIRHYLRWVVMKSYAKFNTKCHKALKSSFDQLVKLISKKLKPKLPRGRRKLTS